MIDCIKSLQIFIENYKNNRNLITSLIAIVYWKTLFKNFLFSLFNRIYSNTILKLKLNSILFYEHETYFCKKKPIIIEFYALEAFS